MRGRSFPAAQTPPAGRAASFPPGCGPSASGTAGCAQTAAAPAAGGEEEQLSLLPELNHGGRDSTHQSTSARLSGIQEGGEVFEQLRPRPQQKAQPVIENLRGPWGPQGWKLIQHLQQLLRKARTHLDRFTHLHRNQSERRREREKVQFKTG